MSEKRVTTRPSGDRIRVIFNGETIADTQQALELHEPPLPVMHYIPLDDIRGDLLHRTEHSSHCPYKGNACYWTIRVGDREARNAVWAYPDPISAVPEIAGHAAFYGDRMDRIIVGED